MQTFRYLPRWAACVRQRLGSKFIPPLSVFRQRPLGTSARPTDGFEGLKSSSSTVHKIRKAVNSSVDSQPQLSDPNLRFGVTLTTGQQVKKRSDKNATQPKESGFLSVSAYGISQMIDLNAVRAEFTLRDHSYHSVRLPSDISHEVLLLSGNQASDPNAQSDVFIFQNGVIVFWNLPESEHKVFISRVRKYCREVVSESRIEREDLRYCFSDEHTRLVGEDIYLQNHEGRVQSHDFHTDERIEQPGDSAATATPSSKHRVDQMVMNQSPEKGLHLVPVEDPIRLEQFAFSEALALSVKLALLENSFDSVAVQMEPWIERMKNGFGLNFPRSSVLKKTGELFTIRHLLNISTSMIETPDFYWDRPEVESLYTQLRTVLSVPTRTRVLNSRLNMCCELTEILSNHLQSRHACRLEWMIILLILVEVAFEAFYYYERRQEKKQLSIST